MSCSTARSSADASGTLPWARRGEPPPRPPTPSSVSLSSLPASTPESSDAATSTDGGVAIAPMTTTFGSENAACAMRARVVHRRRVANDDPSARRSRRRTKRRSARARDSSASSCPAFFRALSAVLQPLGLRRHDRTPRRRATPTATPRCRVSVSKSLRARFDGALAADELDARRLSNLLVGAQQHGADLGGRAHVRAAARAAIDVVNRDDAQRAFAIARFAQAGRGSRVLEGHRHRPRFGDDRVGARLRREHLLMRDELGVEIQRRRVRRRSERSPS